MKNIVLLIIILNLFSCKTNNKKIILLSKASKNYIEWIKDDNIIILDAYSIKNTDSILKISNGIILTGGEDINPLIYGDSSNLEVCEYINHNRDSLELKIFKYALDNKIPLLGICRGMQMINVAYGGSLYGDIPSQLGTETIHRKNGETTHIIKVNNEYKNSYYYKLIFPNNKNTFLVNSFHHQGLKKIAPGVHILAKSPDGLPEAIAIDTIIHPYMTAVQFHPERLEKNNPISKTIKNRFINKVNE
tara:strand:- start:72375 stop:73115 length:741 start_codon:yes stop_codon:yes gene_type:complete